MFQGATSLSLDAKGRMAVPARHRDALTALSGGRLVLTAHPHQCLLLYPESAWAPIRDRILAAPSFDPRSAATKRVLLGNALDVAMDAAGRLLITPELRTVADLGKQVWLVGMGSHFEIWSEAGWKRQHEAAFEALASPEPPPGFEDFSL
ncbi:MAG TPA: division/cell wall cluster transcriptional repressor MraZ [Rhodocyclaceae bacterium]|nr:division/cell wall cluster transcriptional repressor MraZ [Rhodocyclaceae bacterium]